MWILVLQQCRQYVRPHLLLFIATNLITHGNAFSLTQMHRNLHVGRPSAAGLLPQAEAPRSPWQPRRSGGQHRVGVSRAAASGHGPPALIRRRGAGTAAAVVVPIARSSFTFSGVFVCERASGCLFKRLVTLVCSTCLGERQSHRPPRGSEHLMLESEMSETSLNTFSEISRFVCVCI